MDGQLTVDFDMVRNLSSQKRYDYVVVGSGFGGGILTRRLVEEKKRVLLIETGGMKFSTHCLNTARPHWQAGKTQGPSQDNDIVYNAVKTKIQTAGGSDPYVGGPVYCLGGRANVWGLYAPQVDSETINKYFPKSIADYLLKDKKKGFTEAFNFLTDESQTENIYPQGEAHTQDLDPTKEKLKKAIYEFYKEHKITPATTHEVELAPIAAEFKPQAPYQFPNGAYSTVDALLDYTYAAEKNLTILTNTEVLRFKTDTSGRKPVVTSLVVRHSSRSDPAEIQVPGAVVILCAGTINTASIALNSGLADTHPCVGTGLTDHQIWGVRFARNCKIPQPPMKLQSNITICGTRALLNVCVNANTFFGRSHNNLQYVSNEGKAEHLPDNLCNHDVHLDESPEVDTVNVTLEYEATLNNDSKVLDLPSLEPVIYVLRDNARNSEADQKEMQALATSIRNNLLRIPLTEGQDPAPRLAVAGFGVVAHEVGTMRMVAADWNGKPDLKKAVVDDNLRVFNHENLYVCDLSVFPVSPPANPSLTLAALALRLAKHLTEN